MNWAEIEERLDAARDPADPGDYWAGLYVQDVTDLWAEIVSLKAVKVENIRLKDILKRSDEIAEQSVEALIGAGWIRRPAA